MQEGSAEVLISMPLPTYLGGEIHVQFRECSEEGERQVEGFREDSGAQE